MTMWPSIDTQWLFYAQLVNAGAVLAAVWIGVSLNSGAERKRIRSILRPALHFEVSRVRGLIEQSLKSNTDPVRLHDVEFGPLACPTFAAQSTAVSLLDPNTARAVYEFYSFLFSTPIASRASSGGARTHDLREADALRLVQLADTALGQLGA